MYCRVIYAAMGSSVHANAALTVVGRELVALTCPITARILYDSRSPATMCGDH